MLPTEPSGRSPLVTEPANHLPGMVVRDHRLAAVIDHAVATAAQR